MARGEGPFLHTFVPGSPSMAAAKRAPADAAPAPASGSPLPARAPPTSARASSLSARASPLSARASSLPAKAAPLSADASPLPAESSPAPARRPPREFPQRWTGLARKPLLQDQAPIGGALVSESHRRRAGARSTRSLCPPRVSMRRKLVRRSLATLEPLPRRVAQGA